MAAQLVRANLQCLAPLCRVRGCMWLAQRRMASGSAGEFKESQGNKTPASKGPTATSEPYDMNVYRVEEYFAHNKFSYYDLEKDMAASRLTQPDPQKPYEHSNPWKSKA